MRILRHGVAVLLVALAWPAGAVDFNADFRARLAAGDIAAARGLAGAEIAAAPDDQSARFALGAAEFLGAVERLLRTLHRHGLENEYLGPGSLAGLPILRLPVPRNPAPEPVDYAALRAMLERFGDDLAEAEAVLAGVDDPAVALPLDLAEVTFDLTGDLTGAAENRVSLPGLFARVAGPFTIRDDLDGPLTFRFDSADAAWLQAYCHLLMAMTDFLLAHDWEDAYTATFHGLFPDSFTPRTALATLTVALREQLAAVVGDMPEQPDCDPAAPACEELWAAWWTAQEAMPPEVFEMRMAASYAGVADAIAFLHLVRWPVVEPGRMASALGHLESMVSLSRETWARALAETDDEREWLPAPKQTTILPDLVINEQVLAGWMVFLDEFEAILQGRKLIPHWRFQQGVNLRRVFTEPRTFDAVMLAQGSGAAPYLEDGPLSEPQTWMQIMELFGGDFFTYFVWIN